MTVFRLSNFDPSVIKELEAKSRGKLAELNKTGRIIGEEIFKNPKEYIKILPSLKKQNCLILLNDLGKANAAAQKLIEESWKIDERLKLAREPFISATNRIYPGTVVNVKKSVRKIDEPLDNVKFYEDPEEKSVRFVSAI